MESERWQLQRRLCSVGFFIFRRCAHSVRSRRVSGASKLVGVLSRIVTRYVPCGLCCMLRYDKSTMMLKELYSNNVPLFMPAASMYLHWADEGVNVLLQRVRGGRGERGYHTHGRSLRSSTLGAPARAWDSRMARLTTRSTTVMCITIAGHRKGSLHNQAMSVAASVHSCKHASKRSAVHHRLTGWAYHVW